MRTARLALLLPWLALTSSCGVSGGPDETADAETVRIDMAAGSYLMSTVLYIGLVEGYFADEGVDLHLHPPGSETGATSVPALDRGKVDALTIPNLIALVNVIDSGARVRIVTSTGYFAAGECSQAALVARRGLFEEGETVTPESLEGKRIDLNPLSHEGYFVESFLRRGGLSLDDVEHAHLPLAARIEAMNRGSIDMTVISEPWLTRMVEEGHRVILRVNEVIPDMQFGVLVFGSRLLDKEREAGRRFVAGYLRAVRQFNEGPTPRNVELAGEFTGLDAETLRRVCWPPIPEDGRIQAESVLAYQRWALEKGLIDRVLPIEDLWDPYYTEAFRSERAVTQGR